MYRYGCSNSLRILVILGCFVLIQEKDGVASPCRSDTQCRTLFEESESLAKDGKHEAALLKLQVALARQHDPRLLISIGRCQLRLHQAELARVSCQQAKQQAGHDEALRDQAQVCIEESAHVRPAAAPAVTPTVSRSASAGGSARAESSGIASAPTTIQMNPSLQNNSTVNVSTQTVPLIKRWWLWTGLSVVAASAVGLGVGLASREPDTSAFMHVQLSLRTP